MKVAILQSNYIPWKGYFHLIHKADVFVFYDCVKYTKNDWRNRNKIYTNNGLQWITVPIPASATRLCIDEVRIKNMNWQEKHFKTLYYSYKRASHFYQLQELIEDYLLEKRWEYLSELNQYLIKKISNKLNIQTEFRNVREFKISGNRVERLISLLKTLNATTYISGPSAREYLKEKEYLFDQNNIKIIYMKYPNYPCYPQLQQPFQNHVSIVDLIANVKWNEIENYIWKYEA